MLYESEVKENKRPFLLVLIILLSFFLHQSIRTGIGNLSIADFILIIIYIYMFVNQQIYLKKKHAIIVIFFICFITFVSVFYTPIVFKISLNSGKFVTEIIKLLILIAFFFIGVRLAELGLIHKLLTVYSYSGFILSVIGITVVLFNIPIYNEILFKYGSRFNGLMNDPNYFAILQITTLPYFIKKNYDNILFKIFIISIIIFSVILSGSKTGLLTLGIFLLIIFIERNIISKKKISKNKVGKNILLIGIYLYNLFLLISNLPVVFNWLNFHFPSTIRVTTLFTDFDMAVSSGGSSRDLAWSVGNGIVKLSPIIGVGIGNYSTIGNKYFGAGVIAHNTYIQLAAEWGLPLTLIFFGSIVLLIAAIIKNKNKSLYLSILKDILIIFLVGSIGISLNNARFFWLALGGASALYNSTSKRCNLKKT